MIATMIGAPANSASELPAHQDDDDDAQFEHKIGGSQLEGHCRREVCTLAKDRPGKRHRGVGTRRGSGTEAECDGNRPWPIVGKQAAHLAVRYHRWAMPESVKPRISGHRISHPMAP